MGWKSRRLLLDSGGLATLSLPGNYGDRSWGERSFSLVSWSSGQGKPPSHWSVGRQVGNKNACLLVHMEVIWTIEITNTNEYKKVVLVVVMTMMMNL